MTPPASYQIETTAFVRGIIPLIGIWFIVDRLLAVLLVGAPDQSDGWLGLLFPWQNVQAMCISEAISIPIAASVAMNGIFARYRGALLLGAVATGSAGIPAALGMAEINAPLLVLLGLSICLGIGITRAAASAK